jgi:putative PIN family toxin of toxin-antitoxin system
MIDWQGGSRWIIDTNVIVSRLLRPSGSASLAFNTVVRSGGKLLFSEATLAELVEVLSRSKFDRYVSAEDRRAFLANLSAFLEIVPVERRIQACRDPKDDKFLEAAVHGRADALITGNADLLVLHPFFDIPILTPDRFLSGFPPSGSAGLLQEPVATYRTARRKTTASTTKA